MQPSRAVRLALLASLLVLLPACGSTPPAGDAAPAVESTPDPALDATPWGTSVGMRAPNFELPVLSGGEGRDDVTGGLGDDLVIAGAGDGVLDGSEGDELNGDTLDLGGIDLGGGTGVSADLGTGVVGGGVIEAALNFENVIGTSGADTLAGSSDDNVMTGGGGADEFQFDLSGPGIGTNTITDFDAAGGDVLVVFGVTDPNSPDPMMPTLNYLPSFDQVGNDTVISFAEPGTMSEVGSVILTDVAFDPSLFDALVLI